MNLVLDFDGTIYGPSHTLKHAVIPLLRQILNNYCRKNNETEECATKRLVAKYGTTSLFMLIQFELKWSPERVLEETYVKGMVECGQEMFLRPGIENLLRKHHPATILTNAPVIWVEYLNDKLGITNLIGDIYGLHKDFLFQKPEIEAFCQITFASVVFIDDSYKNCEVANNFGWKSFWFPESEAMQGAGGNITRIDTAFCVYNQNKEKIR